MELIFATQNTNKVKEIQKMLPDSIKVLSLLDIGHTEELEENQLTLEGNAQQKAEFVFKKYGKPCFADDTGLEVSVLNNEPGVLSARYAGPDKSDEKNMALLLNKLEGKMNRSAQFRTVIAFADQSGTKFFEGIAKGKILKEKRGEKGFGYDPIFMALNKRLSFAEMSVDEKNSISHRGKAVRAFLDFIRAYS